MFKHAKTANELNRVQIKKKVNQYSNQIYREVWDSQIQLKKKKHMKRERPQ